MTREILTGLTGTTTMKTLEMSEIKGWKVVGLMFNSTDSTDYIITLRLRDLLNQISKDVKIPLTGNDEYIWNSEDNVFNIVFAGHTDSYTTVIIDKDLFDGIELHNGIALDYIASGTRTFFLTLFVERDTEYIEQSLSFEEIMELRSHRTQIALETDDEITAGNPFYQLPDNRNQVSIEEKS